MNELERSGTSPEPKKQTDPIWVCLELLTLKPVLARCLSVILDRLNFQEQSSGLFENFFDRFEEANGLTPVDDSVIVG